MSLSIAEYLGQRTDVSAPIIRPVPNKTSVPCPFMNSHCEKVASGNKPVCTVRKTDGTPWIVCRHRLCATKKDVPLSDYQKQILLTVAETVFGPHVNPNQILVKRETSIHVVDRSSYMADFILINDSPSASSHGPSKVILEMQGGGETSNTGKITRYIRDWENQTTRTNEELRQIVQGAAPIVTNAWRRQQEQFLIKGRTAMQTGTGCGIVFCVGTLLYDYLWSRVRDANLRDLRTHNWTLALVGFKEDTANSGGSLKFTIDNSRLFFTDYQTFVRAIVDVGHPSPESFLGKFDLLSGGEKTLS